MKLAKGVTAKIVDGKLVVKIPIDGEGVRAQTGKSDVFFNSPGQGGFTDISELFEDEGGGDWYMKMIVGRKVKRKKGRVEDDHGEDDEGRSRKKRKKKGK